MRPAGFDPQPTLIGETLNLRPLKADDREGLYSAASDPAVWAGHPIKDRHERAVFAPYFDFLLGKGSTLAVRSRAGGKIIGCSSYYTAPDRPGTISIGFTFLGTAYWGGAANFEMKQLMIEHALDTFDDVWFHIDPMNIRSQKATAKLGAAYQYDAALNLGGTPAPFKTYCLTRTAWEKTCAARVKS